MITLETPRLRLPALDIMHTELLVTDRPELERRLGLNVSHMRIDPLYQKEIDEAMPWLLRKAEEFPEAYPWFSPWEIIHREFNLAIGGMGFAGPPDENGRVIFGYHVDENHQRKGYASEAAEALCAWAFEDPRVQAIAATIPPGNFSSQRVVRKNGFLPAGQIFQEGMELYVFEKRRISE